MDSPLTALLHVAVLPASIIVGGEAPRPLAPSPGVPAVVVSALQLHILTGWEDELVWLSRHPTLAGPAAGGDVGRTIVATTTASVTVACKREDIIIIQWGMPHTHERERERGERE